MEDAQESAESAQKDAKGQDEGIQGADQEQSIVAQAQGQCSTVSTKTPWNWREEAAKKKERTYKRKERMLEALAKLKGANITQAAQLAGIERSTHYKWLQSDPKYKESANNAFQELGDALESVAYQMSMEKNPTALFKTLEAKFKDRGWGTGPQTALQVNTQVNTGELTFDQIKKAAEKVLEAKYGKPQPK
jgi:hypothetical protein